jgi:cytochrome c-type biogenesis protein CcmE
MATEPAPRRIAIPMKLLLGGAAILLAAAYLVFVSLGPATVYYFTVGELHDRGTGDQLVRVSGKVEPGSVVREGPTVRFAVYDAGGHLPVVYRGVVPDIFAEEMEVVVEGRYAERDLFRATTLLTKCPSRFEA